MNARFASILALVALSAIGCATAETTSEAEQPIVGGVVETRHPAAGYLVARINEGVHTGEVHRPACGATLIGSRAVITSAFCVAEQWSAARTVIAVGFGDGPSGTTYEVEGTWRDWVHPQFLHVWDNPDPNGEDSIGADGRFAIAIVPLKRAVSEITPMPIARAPIAPNTSALVIGYGRVTEGDWGAPTFETDPLDPTKYPGTRKSAAVTIDDARVVLRAFPVPGASASGGVCIGDFGGPIVLGEGTLAGVLLRFSREDMNASTFDGTPICRPDTGGEYANLQWGSLPGFVADRLAALAETAP